VTNRYGVTMGVERDATIRSSTNGGKSAAEQFGRQLDHGQREEWIHRRAMASIAWMASSLRVSKGSVMRRHFSNCA